MHIGQKLKEILHAKRVNLTQLAPKIGMTRQNLYLLFERNTIESETIELIKKETGIKLDLTNVNTTPETSPESQPRGNIIFVPLYVYGGFLTGYADQIFMSRLQRFSLPGINGEHYAFEVDGISMQGFASPGDWAISRPEEKIDYMVKGKAYVLQTIDGLIIKYFDRKDADDNGKVYFKSHNPEWKETVIPKKSIKRVYYVDHILKKT